MSLSKTQKDVLDKMALGKVYCAYDLGVSVRTLDALVRRGRLTKSIKLGSMYSPRVSIGYSKIPLTDCIPR